MDRLSACSCSWRLQQTGKRLVSATLEAQVPRIQVLILQEGSPQLHEP